MVNICVKQRQELITEVAIQDHAGYAPKGQDLVCAGVSSITVGMMNALDKLNKDACNMHMKEAYIEIKVTQVDNQNAQLLLKAMMTQLETMEITYHKFIQISYQEV